jgi:hypothetical protein
MKTLRLSNALTRGLFGTTALVATFLVTAPTQASAADFFGVVPQRDISELDFDRLGDANVGTLRIGVNWPNLQPTKESSDEIGKNLDDEFGGAAAAGVTLLPFVNNSPPWVSRDEDIPPIGSDRDRKAFKNFMELLVERYGPGGEYWTGDFLDDFPGATPKPPKHWQIWNEPSSPASWEPQPSARDYADLVMMAEKAIHNVDRGANVMLAGIFYSPSNGGPEAPKFMGDLLKVNGLKNAIDSAAVHAYGKNVDDVAFQVEAVRDAMDDRGAKDKELFITETGWSTCRQNVHPVCTTESGQAKKLKQAFRMAKEKKRSWNLGGVYWYSLVDAEDGHARCDFCAKTGLFDKDRNPKPAWNAFKSFTD